MSLSNPQGALKQYHQVGVQAATAGASPHILIQMLIQGALDRVASAKGYMQRGEPEKGMLISKAISILDGLREALNRDAGGEIADNLDRLYDYCQHRLLQSNVENDPAILDEVTRLLRGIKGAWDTISDLRAGGAAPEAST
jgi:flagellar protein FliS